MIRQLLLWPILFAFSAPDAQAQTDTVARGLAISAARSAAQVKAALSGSAVASDTADRSFTTIVGSQLLVSPNPDRVGLSVCNNASAAVALSIPPRVLASVTDAGAIQIAAAACYTFPVAPKGDVYVYSAAASALTVSDSSASLPDGQYSRRTIGASARMGQPVSAVSGNLSTTSRTTWYARSDSDITDHTLLFSGWYYGTGSPSAVVNTSVETITASIEYSAGVLTQVTFGGNAAAALTPGTTLSSDATRLRIPAGAKFYVRECVTVASNTSPVAYVTTQGNGTSVSSSFDNNVGSASAASDYTMVYSGFFPADGSGNAGGLFVAPSAIVSTALTNSNPKAAIIWGDSIAYGQGDTAQSTKGAQGWTGRLLDIIGIPYVKIGRPGIGAASLLQANTVLPTRALSGFLAALPASHTLMQIGTNDILGGTTPAQEVIDYGKLWALTPKSRPILATFVPRTSSTDNWATAGNQTLLNNMANAIVMATIERGWGSIPIIEAGNAASPTPDANVWTGSTPPLVVDGTHPSTLGATTIANNLTVQTQAKAAFAK